jgi:HrpA-like RNA helicase
VELRLDPRDARTLLRSAELGCSDEVSKILAMMRELKDARSVLGRSDGEDPVNAGWVAATQCPDVFAN